MLLEIYCYFLMDNTYGIMFAFLTERPKYTDPEALVRECWGSWGQKKNEKTPHPGDYTHKPNHTTRTYTLEP